MTGQNLINFLWIAIGFKDPKIVFPDANEFEYLYTFEALFHQYSSIRSPNICRKCQKAEDFWYLLALLASQHWASSQALSSLCPLVIWSTVYWVLELIHTDLQSKPVAVRSFDKALPSRQAAFWLHGTFPLGILAPTPSCSSLAPAHTWNKSALRRSVLFAQLSSLLLEAVLDHVLQGQLRCNAEQSWISSISVFFSVFSYFSIYTSWNHILIMKRITLFIRLM